MNDIPIYKIYMERLRNQRVKILNKNIGEGFILPNIKAYYKVTVILLKLDSLVSLERWPHSYPLGVAQVGRPHSCCSKTLLLCPHPYTLCSVRFPRIQPWVNPGTFWTVPAFRPQIVPTETSELGFSQFVIGFIENLAGHPTEALVLSFVIVLKPREYQLASNTSEPGGTIEKSSRQSRR